MASLERKARCKKTFHEHRRLKRNMHKPNRTSTGLNTPDHSTPHH